MPAAAALFATTAATTTTATVGAATLAGSSLTGAVAGAGAGLSTLASAGAALGSIGFGYKQYQAGKEAAKTQQAMEGLRAQRSQLQALREAQIQRAMLTQRSAVSGSMDSSGFAGGMSSIGSQLAGNQMFANQMTGFGRQLAGQQQTMNRFGALSQLSGQVAQFGMSDVGSNYINSFGRGS